ncbi:MAG: ABC transporter ATP-binding protein [Candidatus Hermodarchaeota archaeon]
MTEPMVKFFNLTKKYHDLIAVNHLNLEIYKGEILGFLGPNGAGKTTTMKILGGLVKPTTGRIEVSKGNGKFVNTREVPEELYKRFGFLIDIPAFYGQVTAKQILKFYCRLLKIPKRDTNKKIDWALEIVELTKWKDKILKEYSKGMIQRLGLAQAIVHNPDILVLDEPQTGLDPSGRLQVRKIIKKLKELGKTIFLSSHLLYEISEICDRIAIINHGELIEVDKITNLEQRMTKKEVAVELLEPIQKALIDQVVRDIVQKIQPYSEKDDKSPVIYDDALPGFHIFYDGKPTSRKEIHDILTMDFNLPIIGYSKIRTSRLEDLYIELVEENNEKNSKNIEVS